MSQYSSHPLFEFEESQTAVINPPMRRRVDNFPELAVACWFGDVQRKRFAGQDPIYRIPFEHGDHEVHVVEHLGKRIAVFNPGVGAPAAATSLEDIIGLGARKIIGCGGAGIVKQGFDVGHIIVPTGAVRDEGTSHHYQPVDVAVVPHPLAVEAIDAELLEAGVPHDKGLTWTTDAIFRETPGKVARRREQGCISVEMEASAMFAVAMFRGAVYGQLLYAGDDVSAQTWDHRHWEKQTSVRERVLELALNAVCRLS
ncbi:MAG: purine-nucleoside phosphorylase [Actinobacteria bacterium]|jgi:uridine phosphorylase|nr:purine-nucleoside phosphorylase [Actinomycetota bacterium]